MPRKLAAYESPPEGGKPVWWLRREIDPRLRRGAVPPEETQRDALESQYAKHKIDRAYQKRYWVDKWREMCRIGRLSEEDCAKVIVRKAKEDSKGEPLRISYNSLRNWYAKFKRGGLEALIPKQGVIETESTRSPEAVAYFYEAYRLDKKLSINLCHQMTLMEAEKRGWSWPVSPASTATWLREHDDLSTTYLFREGMSAWSRKFLPHVEFDDSGVSPADRFLADHHQCDFWVEDGKDRFRPWITAILDYKSRVIVGWHVGPTPHQDAIIAALRTAFLHFAIPKKLTLDNGRDFASKTLSGFTKAQRGQLCREHGRDWFKVVKRDANLVPLVDTRFLGILPELGIEVQFALPYCPWSKGRMERWFETFEGQCGKLFDTYCGRDANTRPEGLKDILRGYTREQRRAGRKKYGRDWKRLVLVDQRSIPTLDEAREQIGNFIELYHRTPHTFDRVSGVIPLKVWNTATHLRRALEKDLIYLMEARGVYRVGANGVHFKVGSATLGYGANCPTIRRLIGRDVFITSNPQDVSFCYAWSADRDNRKLIARLESNKRVPANTCTDEVREVIAEKKRGQSVMQKASRARAKQTRSMGELLRANQREKLQQLRATGTDGGSTPTIEVVRTGFETASKPIQNAPVSTPDDYVPFDVSELDRLPETPHSVDALDCLFKSEEELRKERATEYVRFGYHADEFGEDNDEGDDERWLQARRNHDLYDQDEPDPDCPFCDDNPPSDARKPLTFEDLKMPWERRADSLEDSDPCDFSEFIDTEGDEGDDAPEDDGEDSGTEALSDKTEQAP